MPFTHGTLTDYGNAIVSPDAELTWTEFVHSGSTNAISLYDGSLGALGIGSGIMLSSGSAYPNATNSSDTYSTDFQLAGDARLDALIPPGVPAGATHDASSLTLTFEITDPNVQYITLTLVYLTEDYPTYDDQGVTDVAGVFVNGSLVPGNNDNPAVLGYFSGFDALNFIANSGVAIEYNGYTSVVTVVAAVTQGTNTLSISIADRLDYIGDSSLIVSDLNTMSVGTSGMFRTVTGSDSTETINNAFDPTSYFYDLGGGADSVHLGTGENIVDAGAGNDEIVGNTGVDAMSGDDGDDVLSGFASADQLDGGVGNDILNGGSGIDTMSGGIGNDLYVVDRTGDVIVEQAGEGTDEVRTSITYTLGANLENLTLTGSANVNGVGNSLANLLIGNSGNNVLNGAGGADIMRGGAGDDTYFVTQVGDRAIEADGAGDDSVRSSISFTLSNYIETLILTGSEAINGFGNNQANALIGNEAGNVLNGGAGADIMRGGAGDDTYVVENSGDQAIETSGMGHDTVRARVTFTIGDDVEDLVLIGSAAINGVGNGLDNLILGNGNANSLSGRDGADSINAGSGDDRLLGGNGADILNGGNGVDWVEGGAGTDVLTGGLGADLFVFYDGDFGGSTPAAADRIRDFSHDAGDRVRLNFVDANTTLGGDQAFAFIGASDFSGAAGELRYFQFGETTYIFGDTNGDEVADFAIRVDGLHGFVAGDFIL